MARITSPVRTEDLSVEECKNHFLTITGEDAAQFLELATSQVNAENLRKLLHVTIILANEISQPAGEDRRHPVNQVIYMLV